MLASIPLPEQFIVGAAVGAALQRFRPLRLPVPPVAARVGGRCLIAAGGALVAVAWRARGWRVDLERPDALVTDGPQRLTRNPMYVGAALMHLGVAVAGRSVWMAATWLPAAWSIHRDVVREEQALAHQFGPDYDQYRQRVPRYLGRVRPPVER